MINEKELLLTIKNIAGRIRHLETLTTYSAPGGVLAGVDMSLIGVTLSREGTDILLFDSGGALLREYPFTAAQLDTALATAAAGDVIVLPAGTLAGAHTVPAGISLVGMGMGSSLTGAITVSGYLFNLQCTVNVTLAGVGTYYIFNVDGDILYSPNFLLGGNSTTDPKQKQTIFAGGPYQADAAIHYLETGGSGTTSVVVHLTEENYGVVSYDKTHVLDADPAFPAGDADGTPSAYCVCRIDAGQLPIGFVVTGIEVTIVLKVNMAGSFLGYDHEIVFWDGADATISENKASAVQIGTDYETRVYGGAADMWTIVGLDTAMINSGDVAFACRYYRNPPGLLWLQVDVDFISVKVFGTANLEYVAGLDVTEGTWAVEPGDTLTGAGLEFDGATGTLKIPAVAPEPPLDVASVVMVTDFNADLLDGQHAAAFQTALTFPLVASLGGTGVANGAGCTLTLPNAATTITVGGTIALGGFTLTVPATGTVALLNQANSFTLINPITTIAESWIGPSSTAGIYFKGGNVGIGTTNPANRLSVKDAGAPQALFYGYSTVGNRVSDDSATVLLGNNASWYGRLDFSGAGGTTFNIDNGYDYVASITNFRMRTAGTPITAMTILGSGNVGIGTTAPTSKLGVCQADVAGAIPCLELDQDDTDDTFINFVGTTAADQTKSISTVNGDGAVTGPKNFSASAGWEYVGMVKVEVNDAAFWMPYYQPDTA